MKYALLTLSFLLTTVAFAHSQTSISSSYFGQHMELLGGFVATPATPFPTASQGGQFGTFRFWDTAYWASIEPTQGQYNWSVVNGIAGILQPKGIDMILPSAISHLGPAPSLQETVPPLLPGRATLQLTAPGRPSSRQPCSRTAG